MDPLSIADLALSILRGVMMEIQTQVGNGTISKEDQQLRIDKLNALRQNSFDGEEWRDSGVS